MCGRYFLDASVGEIESLVGKLAGRVQLTPRYNIAPEQPIPIIREDAVGETHLALVRWGLVPGWSKGPDRRFSMINARAETVDEKPAFRSALRYRRCLIPASGFYEWRAAGKQPKQPFVIRRRDHELMMFAGLWEHWMDPEGNELESASIIVTTANAAVQPVHERMPVILSQSQFHPWLDRTHQHTQDLLPWLQPSASVDLEVYPIDRAVNNPQHDYAELTEPVANDQLLF